MPGLQVAAIFGFLLVGASIVAAFAVRTLQNDHERLRWPDYIAAVGVLLIFVVAGAVALGWGT